jgi:hypothetical protein
VIVKRHRGRDTDAHVPASEPASDRCAPHRHVSRGSAFGTAGAILVDGFDPMSVLDPLAYLEDVGRASRARCR